MIVNRVGAIIRRDGQHGETEILLLVYRYGNHLVYNIPGGKMDTNQTLADTLVRELNEELGVLTTVHQLVLLAETQKPNKTRTLHFLFDTTITTGTPTINPNETSAAKLAWVPLSSLTHIHLYPSVAQWLHPATPLTNKYIGEIPQPWVP
jgi:8-oxo-dGTP diphosphatase